MVVSSSVVVAAVRDVSTVGACDGHVDRLGDARRPHLGDQPQRLADADLDVLLHERREAGQLERDRVAAGRQLQRREAALAIGLQRPA